MVDDLPPLSPASTAGPSVDPGPPDSSPVTSTKADTSAACKASPGHLTFGELARRMASWTSSLLVTFLILAAGLTFGLQVLRWWGGESGRVPPETPSVEGGRPQGGLAEMRTRAGNLTVLTVTGDRDTIETRCRELCLQATKHAMVPTALPASEELHLLQKLLELTPVFADGSGLAVYRYPGEFPFWVGVKTPLSGNQMDGTATRRDEQGEDRETGMAAQEVTPSPARLVVWTVALAVGPEDWTIYCVTPQRSGVSSLTAQLDTATGFPVPPGASATLGLTLGGNSEFCSFEESLPGAAANWCDFIDRRLLSRGWRGLGEWTTEAGRRHRRFWRGDSADGDLLVVEIQCLPGRTARGFAIAVRGNTTLPPPRANEPAPAIR